MRNCRSSLERCPWTAIRLPWVRRLFTLFASCEMTHLGLKGRVLAVVFTILVLSVVYPALAQRVVNDCKILSNTQCAGANLQKADLHGVVLERANLQGAKMQGVDLQGANLQGANITGADLTGANLANANLTGASLIDAVLQKTNLAGANLSKASIARAKLGDTILGNAIWTDGRKCASGSIDSCK